ncbi:hypothetical protein WN51_10367 [Melipona quadrifasciata]|uniref:Uncharacterized protein n=1 Tax=Melipona quadrifasciata TaxID=166423 RepID=A0A0M9A9E8_9HYME|nr:hypothetical protein WN51_10367 [Melipona quadrifasciata]
MYAGVPTPGSVPPSIDDPLIKPLILDLRKCISFGVDSSFFRKDLCSVCVRGSFREAAQLREALEQNERTSGADCTEEFLVTKMLKQSVCSVALKSRSRIAIESNMNEESRWGVFDEKSVNFGEFLYAYLSMEPERETNRKRTLTPFTTLPSLSLSLSSPSTRTRADFWAFRKFTGPQISHRANWTWTLAKFPTPQNEAAVSSHSNHSFADFSTEQRNGSSSEYVSKMRMNPTDKAGGNNRLRVCLKEERSTESVRSPHHHLGQQQGGNNNNNNNNHNNNNNNNNCHAGNNPAANNHPRLNKDDSIKISIENTNTCTDSLVTALDDETLLITDFVADQALPPPLHRSLHLLSRGINRLREWGSCTARNDAVEGVTLIIRKDRQLTTSGWYNPSSTHLFMT